LGDFSPSERKHSDFYIEISLEIAWFVDLGTFLIPIFGFFRPDILGWFVNAQFTL